MNLRTFGLILVAGALSLPLRADLCGNVAGNLVANCGFETGDLTSWTTGGNFEFTSVVSGPYSSYSGSNSGGDYLAMGPVGADANISQILTTTSGDNYTFSFYLNAVGDSPSDFSAYWNGTQLLSLTDPNTSGAWTQEMFTVTGTGSDTIQFNFADNPAYLALDDIAVTSSSATPEPGTLGLLLGGIGLVSLGIRRRKR